MRAHTLVVGALVLTAATSLGPGGSIAPTAARPPALGLADDPAFNDFRAPERRIALDRAVRAGARTIRFTLDWSLVAPDGPVKPPRFRASDPADGAYDWGYAEDFARAARARGLRILFTVVHAPIWAEASARPSSAPAGSWKPDEKELAAFVRAAARRFSGFFPDPKAGGGDGLTGEGRSLPRVRYWQIWDEPNTGQRLRPLAEAPVHYRRMLNAAARALHAVDPGNRVVTAGTGSEGRGMAPLKFWRRLLCLKRVEGCPEPTLFDVYAHHPSSGTESPFREGSRNDIRPKTLGRLSHLVDVAGRQGLVRHASSKRLWVTKLAWPTVGVFSSFGLSPARQARFLAEALRTITRRSPADVVIWEGLRDSVQPEGSFFPGHASGLYFNHQNDDPRRDAPKPAYHVFRFPFALSESNGRLVAWGVVPPRNLRRVAIQRLVGDRWMRVVVVTTDAHGQFLRRFDGPPGVYRAVTKSAASWRWDQR